MKAYNKDFFKDLINQDRKERKEYLDRTFSVTDLELMACEFYYVETKDLNINLENEHGIDFCGKEKILLKDILYVRKNKMNVNFSWNDNYKKQLLELNNKLLNGFSIAYKEAKAHFQVLKERIISNEPYLNGFNIEIKLKPFILVPNEDEYFLEERRKGIYYILYNLLPESLWSSTVAYEQELDKFFSEKYENNGENFNTSEYLEKGIFDDSFICWAMNELFIFNEILSWYDILKINEIWTEVHVNYQHFLDNIGKGVFWNNGIQSLSENEAENIRQEYMVRFSKDMSGLPVEILVDEMNIWEKICSFRRIKFQGNKSSKIDFRKMYSMSIEENPRVLVKNAKIDLSDDELQQVKDFVSKNREALINISEQKITLLDFARSLGKL